MNSSPKYIAVIEDDAEDSEFFCSVLTERFDINLLLFSGAAEFYEYLESDSRFPDLIVTDLRMPWISGFELIEKVKKDPVTEHIPIVVLSTSSRIEDREKAAALGAIEYFVKPYTYREYDAIAMQIIDTPTEVAG